MSTKFEDQLITSVYLRPWLYDRHNVKYSKKMYVMEAWKEVAEECGKDEQSCRTRWRSLKDTFIKHRTRRDRNGEGDDPRWRWYDSLQFLSDHYNSTRTTSSLDSDTDINVDEEASSRIEIIEIKGSNDEMESLPRTTKRSSVGILVPHSKVKKKRSSLDVQMSTDDEMRKPEFKESSKGTIDSFVTYISSEMRSMSEIEQDKFKFGIMDVLKEIKFQRGTSSL